MIMGHAIETINNIQVHICMNIIGWDNMGRGKENEVTVQITNTGQFLITIPKAIAFALELDKGMKMEWMIRKEGLLLRHSKGDR